MLVDILMLVIIAITIMVYFKNGFAVSLFNTASTVISVALIIIFHNPLTEFIKNSPAGQALYEAVNNRVGEMFLSGAGNALNIEQAPKFMQEFLNSGVQTANEAVLKMTDKILGITVAVVTFVLLIVVFKLVSALFPKLLKAVVGIPVIKQIDKLMGGVLGAVVGIIWMIIAIYAVGLLSLVPALQFLDEQLSGSVILTALQNLYIGEFLF